MSDELVKQWDEYVESMGSVMGDVEHMTQQMRDRIEQLIAERDSLLAGHRTLNIDGARLETRIEKLIAEREMAANWWKEAVELTQQARLQYSEEKARAEKAEAERDRLRAALSILLEEYVSDVDPYRVAGFYRDPETEDCVVKARAALKGESHE